MPNFIFAYHGGKMPETPEAIAVETEKWGAWYGALGSAIVDGGGPVGLSKTVSSNGVENNGGANPLSGYTIVKADTIEEACEMAKGSPQLASGTVEVVEIIDMQQ